MICGGCGWKDVGMVRRYTVNALHCDMWVVCARLPNALLLVPLVMWGSVFFFGGSASLYDWFYTFWKVLFL